MRQPGTPWTPFRVAESVSPTSNPVLNAMGMSSKAIMFQNSRYTVIVEADTSGMASDEFPEGMPVMHLSIRRNDRKTMRSWRDLQRLKSEICGAQCEAIEIFPAEERVLDGANQYHLYVFPPRMMIPLGVFSGRQVADDDDVVEGLRSMGVGDADIALVQEKARQEPFEDGKDAGRYEDGLLAPLWEQLLAQHETKPLT